MSSLEAVNKTLGRIEEDTDLLNRNFHKWFLTQERSKLDAEEDRRERNKLLAMLGTAAAAGAGRGGRGGRGGGGGGKASGGMNPLAFLNNLPPWAKLLLGVYAGKAVYGAYRVATAPQRYGNKLGQTAVNYYDERQRRNIEAAEAIRQAERKAETDRLLDELKAASKTPDAPQASEPDTLSGAPKPSADAPLTASRTPPLSPSPATKIEPPSIITKALLPPEPNVDSKTPVQPRASELEKPLLPNAPEISTNVSDLRNMRILINGKRVSYLEKGRGYIPVKEAIDRLRKAGLDARGNPIPTLPLDLETEFTVDRNSAPAVENKFTPIGEDGPRKDGPRTSKVSSGGVALAGLGIFDAADTINSIIEQTYGPQSVLNPNPTATGGALFVNTLAGLLQAGGEAFDLVSTLYGAATGKDSQTSIGQELGDFVRDGEWGRRVAGQGGEVGLNPLLARVASTLAEKTERGIQYAIDGVGLVFGTTTNAEIQDRIIQQEIAKGKDLAELGSPGLIPLEKMSDANIAAALALIEAAKAQTEAANAAVGR